MNLNEANLARAISAETRLEQTTKQLTAERAQRQDAEARADHHFRKYFERELETQAAQLNVYPVSLAQLKEKFWNSEATKMKAELGLLEDADVNAFLRLARHSPDADYFFNNSATEKKPKAFRGDMSLAEKAEFVRDHGSAAFLALPVYPPSY